LRLWKGRLKSKVGSPKPYSPPAIPIWSYLTEADLKSARSALRQTKESYAQAISQRSSSQREVNELLQRKHAWTPTDLERFTSLYRSDHANEQAETAAQEALTAVERAAEEAASKLSKTILARYHEEQIWSDKIRRMSTWGTWGLMGVNVLLFLVFQVLVEPWRRKRLVKGFEEKVVSALERENVSHADSVVKEAPAVRQDAVIDMAPSPAVASETFVSIDPNPVATIQSLPLPAASIERPPDSPATPAGNTPSPIFETYQDMIQDLFSERIVSVSQRDLTTVALEGAVAGAALVGFLVVLLRPK
jgi:sensitive to high expression protein 9